MNAVERGILETFKTLVTRRVRIRQMYLFGSRARGDAAPGSDMDVLVVTEDELSEKDSDFISDCAWEAGFEHGIVVVPVVFSREEWENGPERGFLRLFGEAYMKFTFQT
jgi:predicted nucleotidyltransferase